jgi:hypothetical protein
MNLMMKDHSSSALLHYSISYLGCATNFTLNLPLPALGSRDNKPLFGSAFEQSANLALFRLGLLDATRRKHGRQWALPWPSVFKQKASNATESWRSQDIYRLLPHLIRLRQRGGWGPVRHTGGGFGRQLVKADSLRTQAYDRKARCRKSRGVRTTTTTTTITINIGSVVPLPHCCFAAGRQR